MQRKSIKGHLKQTKCQCDIAQQYINSRNSTRMEVNKQITAHNTFCNKQRTKNENQPEMKENQMHAKCERFAYFLSLLFALKYAWGVLFSFCFFAHGVEYLMLSFRIFCFTQRRFFPIYSAK